MIDNKPATKRTASGVPAVGLNNGSLGPDNNIAAESVAAEPNAVAEPAILTEPKNLDDLVKLCERFKNIHGDIKKALTEACDTFSDSSQDNTPYDPNDQWERALNNWWLHLKQMKDSHAYPPTSALSSVSIDLGNIDVRKNKPSYVDAVVAKAIEQAREIDIPPGFRTEKNIPPEFQKESESGPLKATFYLIEHYMGVLKGEIELLGSFLENCEKAYPSSDQPQKESILKAVASTTQEVKAAYETAYQTLCNDRQPEEKRRSSLGEWIKAYTERKALEYDQKLTDMGLLDLSNKDGDRSR